MLAVLDQILLFIFLLLGKGIYPFNYLKHYFSLGISSTNSSNGEFDYFYGDDELLDNDSSSEDSSTSLESIDSNYMDDLLNRYTTSVVIYDDKKLHDNQQSLSTNSVKNESNTIDSCDNGRTSDMAVIQKSFNDKKFCENPNTNFLLSIDDPYVDTLSNGHDCYDSTLSDPYEDTKSLIIFLSDILVHDTINLNDSAQKLISRCLVDNKDLVLHVNKIHDQIYQKNIEDLLSNLFSLANNENELISEDKNNMERCKEYLI
ncbi:hypothetical protein COBT_001210 [Conglomerata obtusa]